MDIKSCPFCGGMAHLDFAHGSNQSYLGNNEWYLTHEHGFSETEKIYIRAMLSGVKDSPTIIPASEEGEA